MKRVLTLFLALMMVVGCMVILPITTGAADTTDSEVSVWDGSTSTKPSKGSGTADDPYLIESAANLAWLANRPNGGNSSMQTLGPGLQIYYAQYYTYYDYYVLGEDGATFVLSDAASGGTLVPVPNNMTVEESAQKVYITAEATIGSDLKVGDVSASIEWGSSTKKYVDFTRPLLTGKTPKESPTDAESMQWGEQVYFKQTCDIDLGYSEHGKSYSSIGGYWAYGPGTAEIKCQWFGGNYDGQGHKIVNGDLSRTNTNARWASGLFGNMWGATVKNLIFEDITVTSLGGPAGILGGRVIGPQSAGGNHIDDLPTLPTVIENVTVTDSCTVSCTITNWSTDDILNGATGSAGAGGLVGNASYVTIKNCYSAAAIKSNKHGSYIGGIVGRLATHSTVTGCAFSGSIGFLEDNTAVGRETHIGGIVGSWRSIGDATRYQGDNEISNCVNMGSYAANTTADYYICVGGILGASSMLYSAEGSTYTFKNNINLSATKAANSVRGTILTTNVDRGGPIVGCFYNNADSTDFAKVVVENCHSVAFTNTNTSGNPASANGLVASVYNNAASEDENCSLASGDSFFSNPNYWVACEAINAGVFRGAGTEEDPYIVDTVHHLEWMRQQAGISEMVVENYLMNYLDGKYFLQTRDIDLGGETLKPIGHYYTNGKFEAASEEYGDGKTYKNSLGQKGVVFGGTYDGGGYTISNGTVSGCTGRANANWASGLFGFIYGATIKNLTLDGVVSEVGSQGGVLVGAAVPNYYISKSEALASGIYTETETTADGVTTVTGNFSSVVSKLIAKSDDDFNVIDNCKVLDTCSLVNKTAASAVDNGRLGGIAGSIACTTVKNCYSAADIAVSKNTGFVGGIVGAAGFGAIIENCVSDADISFDYGEGAITTGEVALGGVVGGIYPRAGAGFKGNFLVNNCTNYGSFSASGTAMLSSYYYGGIMGGAYPPPFHSGYTNRVSNCYNIGTVTQLGEVSYVKSGSQEYTARIAGIIGSVWTHNGDAADGTIFVDNCYSVEQTCNSYINYYNETNQKNVRASDTYAAPIPAIQYQGNVSNGYRAITFDCFVDTDGNGVLSGDETVVKNTDVAFGTAVIPVSIGMDYKQATSGAVDIQTDHQTGMRDLGTQIRNGENSEYSLRILYALDRNIVKPAYKNIEYTVTLTEINGTAVASPTSQTTTQTTVYASFRNYITDGNGNLVLWTEGCGYEQDEDGYAYELLTASDIDDRYTSMSALTINNIPDEGTFTFRIEAKLNQQDWLYTDHENNKVYYENGGDEGVIIGENVSVPVIITVSNGAVTSYTWDVSAMGH